MTCIVTWKASTNIFLFTDFQLTNTVRERDDPIEKINCDDLAKVSFKFNVYSFI